MSYVYSLNFRIARQIQGASKCILPHILKPAQNTIYSTLIVGSPGTGKTTILRDIAKTISTGIKIPQFQGITVRNSRRKRRNFSNA
ncbi:MAG: AAA family ATPase [Clostridia bacterium]|nr:AAA family ATPase [Clostridia bacterium]